MSGPILNSAVDTVRPLIEERKHKLTVSFGSGSLRVKADPVRLEQVGGEPAHERREIHRIRRAGSGSRPNPTVPTSSSSSETPASASRPRSCPRCSSYSSRETARLPARKGARNRAHARKKSCRDASGNRLRVERGSGERKPIHGAASSRRESLHRDGQGSFNRRDQACLPHPCR